MSPPLLHIHSVDHRDMKEHLKSRDFFSAAVKILSHPGNFTVSNTAADSAFFLTDVETDKLYILRRHPSFLANSPTISSASNKPAGVK